MPGESTRVQRQPQPIQSGVTESNSPQPVSDIVLGLVTSLDPSLRRDGIKRIALVLKGGRYSYASVFGPEIDLKRATRTTGIELAIEAVTAIEPQIAAMHQQYLEPWINGGAEETWLVRIRQNAYMISQLEAYHPGAAVELTRRFGIKNFYRFSLAHWQRQFDERDETTKSHVPFFMSTLDDTGIHEQTAQSIEEMEKRHHSRLSMRVYEWGERDELGDLLLDSARRFGPAKRNVYIITHGNQVGLSGGVGRRGKVTYYELGINGFPETIAAATDTNASVVIISCNTGMQLDHWDADDFSSASFAERLAELSGRTVIAPTSAAILKRIQFAGANHDNPIIPVFASPQFPKDEMLGRRFVPSSKRRE